MVAKGTTVGTKESAAVGTTIRPLIPQVYPALLPSGKNFPYWVGAMLAFAPYSVNGKDASIAHYRKLSGHLRMEVPFYLEFAVTQQYKILYFHGFNEEPTPATMASRMLNCVLVRSY
jgi:hypothetical protein